MRLIDCLGIIATITVLSACSKWELQECETGVRCTPGFKCTTEGDACVPVDSLCGNGTIDIQDGKREACDDGNVKAGDGCSADCGSNEECGNGLNDPGEICDYKTDPSCRHDCKSTTGCGDGYIGSLEQCDDGDTEPGDGCSPLCQLEFCGNGIKDLNEACDNGNNVDAGYCSDDCRSDGSCGNGIEDPGEVCDDGNDEAGDGCHHSCMSDETCGNGYWDEETEECDCGTDISTRNPDCDEPNSQGTCSSLCKLRCGDGEISPPEACDGNTVFCADLFSAPKEKAMGTAGCMLCMIYSGDCKNLDWIQTPQIQSSSYIDSTELRAAWGTDYNKMVIVGAHGVILRYRDSVAPDDTTEEKIIDRWDQESPPHDVRDRTLYGVWGSGTHFYAVGESGTILSSTAAGAMWTSVSISPPVNKDLRGIWGSNLNNIYAVGESGTILRRDDDHWQPVVPSGISRKIDETLRSVWGSGSDIYVVGESGTILHFDGMDWEEESPEIADEANLYGVWGFNGHVYAVGANGTILHRDPHEELEPRERWQRMDVPTDERISAIWGTGANDIVAAGHNGTLLHYKNQHWTPIRSSTDEDFRSIWTFVGSRNQKIPIAVGTNGKIHRFAYDQLPSEQGVDHAW